jgi:Nitrile hydratase beta subunit
MSTPKRKTMLRKGAGGRAAHDVGGLEFGPIDREEHDLALWEKRTDAMLRLLTGPEKRAFTVDGMRRVIEDYGQQQYDRTNYYEKWIRAVRDLVVEQGILTREDVEARMNEVRAKWEKAGRRTTKEKVPW